MRTTFRVLGPADVIFTTDVSVSTKQIWVCIPRGCLTKLTNAQIIEVVAFSAEIKKRLTKPFKGWRIHA